MTFFVLHGHEPRNPSQLGCDHIDVGSSKIQGLCPATGLQRAQQDRKLHSVVVLYPRLLLVFIMSSFLCM